MQASIVAQYLLREYKNASKEGGTWYDNVWCEPMVTEDELHAGWKQTCVERRLDSVKQGNNNNDDLR